MPRIFSSKFGGTHKLEGGQPPKAARIFFKIHFLFTFLGDTPHQLRAPGYFPGAVPRPIPGDASIGIHNIPITYFKFILLLYIDEM